MWTKGSFSDDDIPLSAFFEKKKKKVEEEKKEMEVKKVVEVEVAEVQMVKSRGPCKVSI